MPTAEAPEPPVLLADESAGGDLDALWVELKEAREYLVLADEQLVHCTSALQEAQRAFAEAQAEREKSAERLRARKAEARPGVRDCPARVVTAGSRLRRRRGNESAVTSCFVPSLEVKKREVASTVAVTESGHATSTNSATGTKNLQGSGRRARTPRSAWRGAHGGASCTRCLRVVRQRGRPPRLCTRRTRADGSHTLPWSWRYASCSLSKAGGPTTPSVHRR